MYHTKIVWLWEVTIFNTCGVLKKVLQGQFLNQRNKYINCGLTVADTEASVPIRYMSVNV